MCCLKESNIFLLPMTNECTGRYLQQQQICASMCTPNLYKKWFSQNLSSLASQLIHVYFDAKAFENISKHYNIQMGVSLSPRN